MSKVVFFNSYQLNEGVSIPDFLLAVEQLVDGYMSKQKGYVSFSLLVDGETWADSTIFETMEDALGFAEASGPNELAERFYTFIDLDTCKSNFYSVEKSF